ncbi:hypothetical protein [Lactobacillus sp. CBA3605]|uniref:hypothetical protein n=1 Tax=Lactobacillus sp. CBA3605 TaxID=2099788 RepID=UPI001F4810D3|nr:hypothetical protein [Lactobacillus sp. CBA3605]
MQQYKLGGVETLTRRKGKRFFSSEFKLNVVDYFQTRNESLAVVVSKYDLSPAQISIGGSYLDVMV